MQKTLRLVRAAAAFPVLIAIVGCGPEPDNRDQRLAEFARQSVAEQAQQNNRVAEVIERDVESRQELLAAHRALTMQLNQQQATIDASRNRLQQERQEIAQQRQHDPIVAAAIENAGMLMACLFPLLVAALVIMQLRYHEPDHAAVAELLVAELSRDNPLFLPAAVVPRLTASAETSHRARPLADPNESSKLPF